MADREERGLLGLHADNARAWSILETRDARTVSSRGGTTCGWEAGIRTPITWSRATCPTVGRPPSASRGMLRRRELPILANPEKDQQAAPGAGRRRKTTCIAARVDRGERQVTRIVSTRR